MKIGMRKEPDHRLSMLAFKAMTILS